MYLGKIMEIGPAEQVIRTPQNPYTRALVSVSPSPGAPDRGRTRTAHDPGRRDARRRTHPDRLPVQPSLSEGVRPLPGRGTAADRCRQRPGYRCWLADGGRRLPVLDAAPVVAPDATMSPAAEDAPPVADLPGQSGRGDSDRTARAARTRSASRHARHSTSTSSSRSTAVLGSSPTATAPCRSRMTATGAAAGSSSKAAAILSASSTLPISPNGTNGTLRSSAAVSGSAPASGRSRERQTHRRGEMRMRHGTDVGSCPVHRQVDREIGRRLRTTCAGHDDAGRSTSTRSSTEARPCGSPMA